jgi:glutathione peroxidase
LKRFQVTACLIGLVLSTSASAAASEPAARTSSPARSAVKPACPKALDHTLARLQDEEPQHLCQYAGRVVLAVNTASFCGYTRQYAGLEQLYGKYRARGFVVLGFPSNDFGQQEPGSAKQIAELCENTFGVRFPMLTKTSVTGPGANPVFAELARQTGSAPQWNFHKYLIGRDGRAIAAYPSSIEPGDRNLARAIERALDAPVNRGTPTDDTIRPSDAR